jgi:hypothetical protein
LIGSSVPNSEIAEYEKALENGLVLLVIELDEHDSMSIREKLEEHYPSLASDGVLGMTASTA